MRINWKTPVDELYHGDNIAYIDLNEDEICHWKDRGVRELEYRNNKNDELYHYGVIGMKWGVRIGRSAQAYTKASKKLNRLDRKADKAVEKAYNKKSKADRKASSFFTSEKGARKADFKAEKALRKATVKANKARKWLHNMESTFSNTPESLSRDQINLGKKYTDIMNRRTF